MLDMIICSKNMFLPGLLHKVSGTVVGHCQKRGGEMKKGMMELPAQEENYSFQCDPLERIQIFPQPVSIANYISRR